jgi:hypothetical protein
MRVVLNGRRILGKTDQDRQVLLAIELDGDSPKGTSVDTPR